MKVSVSELIENLYWAICHALIMAGRRVDHCGQVMARRNTCRQFEKSKFLGTTALIVFFSHAPRLSSHGRVQSASA